MLQASADTYLTCLKDVRDKVVPVLAAAVKQEPAAAAAESNPADDAPTKPKEEVTASPATRWSVPVEVKTEVVDD